MGAAAVLEVDDVTVGRQLVAADAEHDAERSAERHHETAVPAHPLGGTRHRRRRTVVAVMPALRGVVTSERTEHLLAAEADLERDVVDQRVTGRGVARCQPRVVNGGRQQIAGAYVGDMGSFVFQRLDDMLEFFRSDTPGELRPNRR